MNLSGFTNDPALAGHSKGFRALWNGYVLGAKSKSLPWCLSVKEFDTLINGSCWFCGHTVTISIDRLDRTGGYTYRNSISCCPACKDMRPSNMTVYSFLKHIDLIADHDRDKKNKYIRRRI